jgi:hypothetical protein
LIITPYFRLILEQASIANDLAKRKENFNKKVERLALERFRTAESIKLLELFLLTLNQELIVLDSFKGGENAIQVVIDEQVAAIQSKQAKVKYCPRSPQIIRYYGFLSRFSLRPVTHYQIDLIRCT